MLPLKRVCQVLKDKYTLIEIGCTKYQGHHVVLGEWTVRRLCQDSQMGIR